MRALRSAAKRGLVQLLETIEEQRLFVESADSKIQLADKRTEKLRVTAAAKARCYEQRIQECEGIEQELLVRLDSATNESSRLSERVAELESELASVGNVHTVKAEEECSRTELRGQLDQAERELNTLREQASTYELEVQTRQHSLDTANAMLAEAERTIDALKDREAAMLKSDEEAGGNALDRAGVGGEASVGAEQAEDEQTTGVPAVAILKSHEEAGGNVLDREGAGGEATVGVEQAEDVQTTEVPKATESESRASMISSSDQVALVAQLQERIQELELVIEERSHMDPEQHSGNNNEVVAYSEAVQQTADDNDTINVYSTISRQPFATKELVTCVVARKHVVDRDCHDMLVQRVLARWEAHWTMSELGLEVCASFKCR